MSRATIQYLKENFWNNKIKYRITHAVMQLFKIYNIKKNKLFIG